MQELEDVYSHNTIDVSLHELNVMTREASQRSQDFGLSLSFVLQHTVDDDGLVPVIKVKKKGMKKFTMWTLDTFKHWLNVLRDQEQVLQQLTSVCVWWFTEWVCVCCRKM